MEPAGRAVRRPLPLLPVAAASSPGGVRPVPSQGLFAHLVWKLGRSPDEGGRGSEAGGILPPGQPSPSPQASSRCWQVHTAGLTPKPPSLSWQPLPTYASLCRGVRGPRKLPLPFSVWASGCREAPSFPLWDRGRPRDRAEHRAGVEGRPRHPPGSRSPILGALTRLDVASGFVGAEGQHRGQPRLRADGLHAQEPAGDVHVVITDPVQVAVPVEQGSGGETGGPSAPQPAPLPQGPTSLGPQAPASPEAVGATGRRAAQAPSRVPPHCR